MGYHPAACGSRGLPRRVRRRRAGPVDPGPHAGTGHQAGALPDPRRPLQASGPGPGRSRRHRLGQDRRLRGDDPGGLQGGREDPRYVVPHARLPGVVRRPDADDQRQPAVHRRAEAVDRRVRPQRQGARRHPLRDPDHVQLPGVRRGARRLLSAFTGADRRGRKRQGRRPQGGGSAPSGHPDARFDLAAERGVLRVRPHGVGCEPPDRERLSGGAAADPAAVLA